MRGLEATEQAERLISSSFDSTVNSNDGRVLWGGPGGSWSGLQEPGKHFRADQFFVSEMFGFCIRIEQLCAVT